MAAVQQQPTPDPPPPPSSAPPDVPPQKGSNFIESMEEEMRRVAEHLERRHRFRSSTTTSPAPAFSRTLPNGFRATFSENSGSEARRRRANGVAKQMAMLNSGGPPTAANSHIALPSKFGEPHSPSSTSPVPRRPNSATAAAGRHLHMHWDASARYQTHHHHLRQEGQQSGEEEEVDVEITMFSQSTVHSTTAAETQSDHSPLSSPSISGTTTATISPPVTSPSLAGDHGEQQLHDEVEEVRGGRARGRGGDEATMSLSPTNATDVTDEEEEEEGGHENQQPVSPSVDQVYLPQSSMSPEDVLEHKSLSAAIMNKPVAVSSSDIMSTATARQQEHNTTSSQGKEMVIRSSAAAESTKQQTKKQASSSSLVSSSRHTYRSTSSLPRMASSGSISKGKRLDRIHITVSSSAIDKSGGSAGNVGARHVLRELKETPSSTSSQDELSALHAAEQELQALRKKHREELKEKDEQIKKLMKANNRLEREKWELLKRARDAAERSLNLRTQVEVRDSSLRTAQLELERKSDELTSVKSANSSLRALLTELRAPLSSKDVGIQVNLTGTLQRNRSIELALSEGATATDAPGEASFINERYSEFRLSTSTLGESICGDIGRHERATSIDSTNIDPGPFFSQPHSHSHGGEHHKKKKVPAIISKLRRAANKRGSSSSIGECICTYPSSNGAFACMSSLC